MPDLDPLALLFAPGRATVPLLLAPMAGVTDWPFRALALTYGADMTVSEMVASQAMIRHAPKSFKIASSGPWNGSESPAVMAVQIAGADPAIMAEAARMNVDRGATMIDINMGCPVKKMAKSHAGAALMRDERLAGRIMAAVVAAVPVPVTVKMRLGWDEGQRNGLALARIAEASGVRAVTVHGRTRAQMYTGQADWRAIGAINTLRRRAGEGWDGRNFDAPAFRAPLAALGLDLQSARAVVLGAGGGARAAVRELLAAPATGV